MEIKEKLFVALIFTGIFLPVRLVFYTYVSQYWLGSFGVMTVLMVGIIYFSRKNKLGWVGRMINKQVMSFSKGKIGLFVIISLVFFIYFFSLVVYGIHNAPAPLVLTVEQIETIQDIENLPEIRVEPDLILPAIFLILIPSEIGFNIFASINDLSDGWLLHFYTVILVEKIEVLGLILYFRFRVTSKPKIV